MLISAKAESPPMESMVEKKSCWNLIGGAWGGRSLGGRRVASI